MKDELGGEIITKFVGLRAKTYSYLIDDRSEDKKAKEKYKYCLQANKLNNKIRYLEKNTIKIDT